MEEKMCSECKKKPAVTNDGLYCRGCLSKRLQRDETKTIYDRGAEHSGRSQRPLEALGGTVDLRTTEEIEDEEDAKWAHVTRYGPFDKKKRRLRDDGSARW